MSDHHGESTALVTGANSGLGFEASAQLAEAGWGRVILACRSVEKAEDARARLVERTGVDPFGVLAVDTSEVASAEAAVEKLCERGERVDFLLLNAGASSKEPTFNTDGVEITYASTLVGHHVMTMRLLEAGVLGCNARIVIAGSEGARSNMPGMKVHDVERVADTLFDGDRAAAITALARLETPDQKDKFANMAEYVTAKMVVAWWVAALSRKLPEGMTVNAVSPGANLSTSFARDASLGMRLVMMPLMKLMGPIMGMNGPIENGVQRYIDASNRGPGDTGHFYATAHRSKLVGPTDIQTWPEYFLDEKSQEAGFNALVTLTGVGFPEINEIHACS